MKNTDIWKLLYEKKKQKRADLPGQGGGKMSVLGIRNTTWSLCSWRATGKNTEGEEDGNNLMDVNFFL